MKFIFLIFLLLLFSCEKSTKDLLRDNSLLHSVEYRSTSEVFIDLVNNHRIDLGLRPLILDARMSQLAFQHSSDMASNAVAFGHIGFSARCAEVRSSLGGGNLCSENVAMGQKSAQAAFTSWMNSSGHRNNIEQARSTHTGFGFKQSSSGNYYWTQIFIELN